MIAVQQNFSCASPPALGLSTSRNPDQACYLQTTFELPKDANLSPLTTGLPAPRQLTFEAWKIFLLILIFWREELQMAARWPPLHAEHMHL